MPRGHPKKIDNLTSRELSELHTRDLRAKVLAENKEKDRLRSAVTAMAKQHGFELKDLISR